MVERTPQTNNDVELSVELIYRPSIMSEKPGATVRSLRTGGCDLAHLPRDINSQRIVAHFVKPSCVHTCPAPYVECQLGRIGGLHEPRENDFLLFGREIIEQIPFKEIILAIRDSIVW